jgi:hypothetical protein
MSQWNKWDGGDCPVREGVIVCVKFRDLMTAEEVGEMFEWEHTGCYDDIVWYKEIT